MSRSDLRDPQTYIQSGNVVFWTNAKNIAPLAKRIKDAIEHKFGFRPGVIVRTTDELRGVVGRNPFAKRSGIDASKLLVTFFVSMTPSPEARDEIARSQNQRRRSADRRSRSLYLFPRWSRTLESLAGD